MSDVPEFMNSQNGEEYDIVIADPPSFAPKKLAVPGALEAYRLLHASVLRVLSQGGIYLAASCSSHISKDMFEKTLLEASRLGKRNIKIEEVWGAGKDHPVLKGFPEGDYLKVFKVHVR